MKRPELLFLAAAVLGARTSRAESIDLSLDDAVARALSEGTAARIAAERVEGARAVLDKSAAPRFFRSSRPLSPAPIKLSI